jgi:hypothetical protein
MQFTYCLSRQRRNARAFCLSVRGFVSLPVRETLALDALKSNCRTFPVRHLAGVPLEIPFREIARQMGFADRMVRAKHGAFHQAETAFGRVDMNEPAKADIFIDTVVHRAVVGELLADFFVGCQFVGHKVRFAANCRDDLFAKRFSFDIGNMKRAAFAIALDERHNGLLFRLFLRMGAVLGFAAKYRFVALDNLVFAPDRAWLFIASRIRIAMNHAVRYDPKPSIRQS